MRKISKSPEPLALTHWKKHGKKLSHYGELPETERQAIR